ncbi:unnamed protein product [Didymodactylos carnosus]|uniref:Uncharacterized protein n=1 Tax=Didymodactylos carnosus TaxID=1234261 RepID=A0A8S2XGX3_9BILA|nr:unnamed protein product [Didymodactylos carnosus]CAF3703993.1 unnamed protein product [Didymodactylos carnosus]CAF4497670.1 unnamed protein product [Didymodactylos carnosus]
MSFNGDWYNGISMKYNQSVDINGILQYDTIWRKIPCKFSSSMTYFYKQGKRVWIYAKHDQDKPVSIDIPITGISAGASTKFVYWWTATGIAVLIPVTHLTQVELKCFWGLEAFRTFIRVDCAAPSVLKTKYNLILFSYKYK